jgi:hypothetical protein
MMYDIQDYLAFGLNSSSGVSKIQKRKHSIWGNEHIPSRLSM